MINLRERVPEPGLTALNTLLNFWLARCEGARPPSPASVSPVELRPWKDHVAVFEALGDSHFVYTYYGSALAAAFGGSRLGASVDDLPEEARSLIVAEYDLVRRERLPASRSHTADFGHGIKTWERLVLPFSTDGETVDKLLVAAYECPSTAAEPAGEKSE